jgi:putative Mn2+ efflux pump MntP
MNQPAPEPESSPSFPKAPPIEQGPPQASPQAAPTEIIVSFWCYLVAAVVGLVGGLLLLGSRQAIEDSLRTANTQAGRYTDAQIHQLATIAIAVTVGIAIVFAALYVLFAFKLKEGKNWARIVLTVLAALALISLLLGRSSLLSFVGEVAAVVGAVLSYLPKSNAYIAASKAPRLR